MKHLKINILVPLLRVTRGTTAGVCRHRLHIVIFLFVVPSVHRDCTLTHANMHLSRRVPSELVLLRCRNFCKNFYNKKIYIICITTNSPPGCPGLCKSDILFCCANRCPFIGSLILPSKPNLISISVG